MLGLLRGLLVHEDEVIALVVSVVDPMAAEAGVAVVVVKRPLEGKGALGFDGRADQTLSVGVVIGVLLDLPEIVLLLILNSWSIICLRYLR